MAKTKPSLQEVGLAIKRLQWRHHRAADRQLLGLGLSLPQWDVLRQLHLHPDASLHELAQLTFQSDQSVGAMAGRMIERGLLERVAGPGRAVRHRLTAEGERLRSAGAGVLDEAMADTLGQLSAKQLAELHRLLTAAGGGA
jgi:DNA-binding MarR family transcriptional regulator